MGNKMTGERPRIYILDSLRGVAAMAVVLSHIVSGFPLKPVIDNTPLGVLTKGHPAVIFFFILSGFVLAYQYNDNGFNYRRFLLQRIFRIYIPYLAAIALSLMLWALCTPHKDFTLISMVWSSPINFFTVLQHIIMIGNYNTLAIDSTIWSLVHEMRIAILFPFLLWVLRLDMWKAAVICTAIYAVSFIAIERFIFTGEGYLSGYSYTLYYFYMFIAGGFIAKYRKSAAGFYQKMTSLQKWLFVAGALLLYNYADMVNAVFNGYAMSAIKRDNLSLMLNDALTATASSCFIIAAIGYEHSNWMNTRIPHFLGKISYSIYLIHLPVMAFLYFTFYNQLPAPLSFCIGLAVVIPMAWLFNKYVERPSVKLAKNLLRKKAPAG